MTPRWRRYVVVLAGLVALNAVVFGAWTLPRTLEDRSLTGRIEILEQEIAAEQAELVAVRERRATLATNAADERRFLAEIVGDRRESLVPVLQDVTRMAQELGLQPRSASYSRSSVKGAPLTRFEITMPVSGTYAQLASFLRSMERSRHFVTVESIGLREEQGGQADLDLVMSAYFRSEPGEKFR